jgi:hypothetical protein
MGKVEIERGEQVAGAGVDQQPGRWRLFFAKKTTAGSKIFKLGRKLMEFEGKIWGSIDQHQ